MPVSFTYEPSTMDTDATHTLDGTPIHVQVCSFNGGFFVIEDLLETEGSIVEHCHASTLGLAKSLAISLAKRKGYLKADA